MNDDIAISKLAERIAEYVEEHGVPFIEATRLALDDMYNEIDFVFVPVDCLDGG